MQPVHPMSDGELDAHVADLQENGYVILREQIAPEYLDPLRDIAQRAADDYIAEWRGGMKLPEVRILDGKGKRNFTINPNARACFMWGEAAMDLLDHDTVHGICRTRSGHLPFFRSRCQHRTLSPGSATGALPSRLQARPHGRRQAQRPVVLLYARRLFSGKWRHSVDSGHTLFQSRRTRNDGSRAGFRQQQDPGDRRSG